MKLIIKTLSEKKLIGKCMKMSLSDNKTLDLWQGFMPNRKEILNRVGTALYSMQVYNSSYFKDFNTDSVFEKWACVEVLDFESIPDGMETFFLKGGLYAVFQHKGGSKTGNQAFQYIFACWLPQSDYLLDNRPHFERLGENFKNEDPMAEEEIWIPVKPKNSN